jgi:hypothetical protein
MRLVWIVCTYLLWVVLLLRQVMVRSMTPLAYGLSYVVLCGILLWLLVARERQQPRQSTEPFSEEEESNVVVAAEEEEEATALSPNAWMRLLALPGKVKEHVGASLERLTKSVQSNNDADASSNEVTFVDADAFDGEGLTGGALRQTIQDYVRIDTLLQSVQRAAPDAYQQATSKFRPVVEDD